jgi:hypothetical protein
VVTGTHQHGILNNYINISKTLNVPCKTRYSHILLPKDLLYQGNGKLAHFLTTRSTDVTERENSSKTCAYVKEKGQICTSASNEGTKREQRHNYAHY